MPVTAKLSRKFYERLGDDIAGELVDWFNAVDSTYQSQLREINELNWERFKTELRAEGGQIRSELQSEIAKLRIEIADVKSDLIKWMFLFWTGTMAAQAAFVWTMVHR